MSDIQIIFEPSRPVYYPGDIVSGYVIVNLSEETKLNEIYLKAKGHARVSFWHGYDKNRWNYRSEKVYLKERITLWQKNEAEGETHLPGGSQKYPFSLTIPYDSVPSIEGTHGHVRYKLIVKLNLPWALDKTFKQKIMVAAPINSNYNPAYNQPCVTQINKNGFFTSSNLQAIVNIPRAVWAAGEIIPVHVNVENNSSNDITGVEVAIIKREAFTGQAFVKHHSLTKECVKKMNSLRTQDLIPPSSSTETLVEIPVPENLITISNCPNITVHYELKVELHTKSIFSSGPSACMPVILSNVPMVQLPEPLQVEENSFQPSTSFPPPYPVAPPPYSLYDSNSTSKEPSSTSKSSPSY
ncbi:hypothetical protein FO519_009868 [Halicephalobus sp. NKZ332]|nr:hypothetical protein FO519_009868 [Halicephalobus sp. NKZ332]